MQCCSQSQELSLSLPMLPGALNSLLGQSDVLEAGRGMSDQGLGEIASAATSTTEVTGQSPGTWIDRARRRYPRSWSKWSAEDDEALRDLVDKGQTIEDMCAALGRGPGGVSSRLVTLGLASDANTAPIASRCSLPVPQMDWVPPYLKQEVQTQWIEETAAFWQVSPAALQQAIASLELNQWLVFVLRYGLCRRCSYTLEAVAELLKVSVEEVANLQLEAERLVQLAMMNQGDKPIAATLDETLQRCITRASRQSRMGRRTV